MCAPHEMVEIGFGLVVVGVLGLVYVDYVDGIAFVHHAVVVVVFDTQILWSFVGGAYSTPPRSPPLSSLDVFFFFTRCLELL